MELLKSFFTGVMTLSVASIVGNFILETMMLPAIAGIFGILIGLVITVLVGKFVREL